MKMNKRFFASTVFQFFFLILFSLTLINPFKADGATDQSVRLSPTRIIFEGRNRSDTIRLINPNPTERRYRISLISVRMDETGTRQIASQPTEKELFAQSLIRFSPRQVTIPGGGSQVVRLMVQKPKDLPDGEYRAHLMVTPIPEKTDTKGEKGSSPEKIGINIDIFFQVSIPILIRQGPGKTEGIVHTPILKKRETGEGVDLVFDLERKGLFSLYSDIIVYRMSPRDGRKEKIGETEGLPSYTPVNRQKVIVPLTIGMNLKAFSGEKLVIDIHDCEKEGKPLANSFTFPDLFSTSLIE